MTGNRQWLADLAITDAETADFTPYHHGGSGSRTSRREPLPERQCVNCDQAFTPTFTPKSSAARYCTPLCRQTARAVRYARSAIATHGKPLPPDVDDATGIKIARVVVGGYRERAAAAAGCPGCHHHPRPLAVRPVRPARRGG